MLFWAWLTLHFAVWSSDREAEGLRSRPGSRTDYRCHRFHRRTHVPHEMVCMHRKRWAAVENWNISGCVTACVVREFKCVPLEPNVEFVFVSFFLFLQEKLRWSWPGAGKGGQREVSAGGHLFLRRETHLALVSHRGREKRRQKLTQGKKKKKRGQGERKSSFEDHCTFDRGFCGIGRGGAEASKTPWTHSSFGVDSLMNSTLIWK